MWVVSDDTGRNGTRRMGHSRPRNAQKGIAEVTVRMGRNSQPRGPQAIGNVLSEVMARRGFARVQSAEALCSAWREAAGPLVAAYTRVGQLRAGTLEVLVGNSTLVQELGFQKQDLIVALARLLPDQPITNLRFRVGSLE